VFPWLSTRLDPAHTVVPAGPKGQKPTPTPRRSAPGSPAALPEPGKR
jgi:hypothetical protein